MHVLILAGGFGTRLKPLTNHTPKQLLKLGDKMIIEYLLNSLQKAELKNMTIAVNSAHEKKFHNALMNYNLDWIIESPKNDENKLGAVGAIWNAKRFLPKKPLLITGADNFAPHIKFKKAIQKHQKENNLATLILRELPDKKQVKKYGVAVTKKNRITGFQEKPKPEDAKSKLVSTAFYIVQPEFFQELQKYITQKKEKKEKPDDLGELWEWMVEQGKRIGYYKLQSYWSDIGSLQGYLNAQKIILKDKGTKFSLGKNCQVGKAEIQDNVVIQDNCTIGDNTRIKNSTIFSKVQIGENCTILNSIIDQETKIEPGQEINNQIIKRGSLIN